MGLIVDGLGEFAAFKARFTDGHRILKTDGPRSHTTSPVQIVSSSRKQVEILRAFGCTKVVIVTDYENRRGTYGEFLEGLRVELARAFPDGAVQVAVPNQMIENWYLADIRHIATHKRFLRRPAHQRSYEGRPGKALLKSLFHRGHSYREAEHGPQFFMLLRFPEARQYSGSLDAFLNIIG